MTEEETIVLRNEQLSLFQGARCQKVITHWQQMVERAPNGWLLYRIGKDKGIGFTEGDGWSNEPWVVMHHLSSDAAVH
ncbi:MAG: hypothetical protein AAF558_04345 [Verrucomicrobiota bacterium]